MLQNVCLTDRSQPVKHRYKTDNTGGFVGITNRLSPTGHGGIDDDYLNIGDSTPATTTVMDTKSQTWSTSL